MAVFPAKKGAIMDIFKETHLFHGNIYNLLPVSLCRDLLGNHTQKVDIFGPFRQGFILLPDKLEFCLKKLDLFQIYLFSSHSRENALLGCRRTSLTFRIFYQTP